MLLPHDYMNYWLTGKKVTEVSWCGWLCANNTADRTSSNLDVRVVLQLFQIPTEAVGVNKKFVVTELL